jgi:hypothetical protein
VNWADRQIGVADAARQPMDLVAVRFFSTTASYTPGQLVVQNGKVYRAVAVISPGTFDPTKWQEITVQSGSGIWVGDEPRAEAPVQGQLLWESDSGDLFVWYEDADGGQWVQINTTGAPFTPDYVTPLLFGGVGNGTFDDTAAVNAALADGRPVNWLDKSWRITSPINFTAVQDISWQSRGATIRYDGAIAQRAVYLNLAGKNFSGTLFAGGEGLMIEGNFERVDLVRPTVKNIRMATGAGSSGTQGIRGIGVIASTTTPFRAARQVIITDADIDTVMSEDPAYQSDQDGLAIFSAEDIVGAVAPYETKAFIRGGRFRNCFGRSIKLQTDYASVSGTHHIRTEGFDFTVGGPPEIDFQVGGGEATDVTCLYAAGAKSLPQYVVAPGTTASATKKVTYGSIKGVKVANSGTTAIVAVVGTGHREPPNQVIAMDLDIQGPHSEVVRLAAASSGVGGVVNNRVLVSNVVTSGPTTSLVRGQSNPLVGFISVGNCINTGAEVPWLSKSSSTNVVEWAITGPLIGFTNILEVELTIVGDAITIGAMDYYIVDTEADAATDDLSTINGGKCVGQTVTLRANNSARTVVLKDNIGNLRLVSDFSLDHAYDLITLRYSTGNVWAEQSRSDNST